ncbi:hypothetical protein PHMEG_00032165 [Phytophthora megakarya]|uniref:Uncharacterized protein n=1 Tax=Phytophthora megakarya TaxID=4795 RepID=A0A225UWM5_9STRA|nr:hypothetical protein PHMEG_00032165 [Phytophthora megakarya]
MYKQHCKHSLVVLWISKENPMEKIELSYPHAWKYLWEEILIMQRIDFPTTTYQNYADGGGLASGRINRWYVNDEARLWVTANILNKP